MAKKKDNKINYNVSKEDVKKDRRLEEAKRIARESTRVFDNNTNKVARPFQKLFRFLNDKLDFILTNSVTAKLLSIALAIMLYLSVNYSGDINVFGQNNVGKNLVGIPVKAVYNKEKYQVENLPETVDLSLVGSVEAIRKTEVLSKQEVIADLTNYKAGKNQKIELLYAGIASGINVTFSQPAYEVNIYDRKKEKFSISPELIRVPLDHKYEYTNIKLSQNEIEINAAQHTLDSIGKVQALIDVSNQKDNFTTMATLIAIDSDGNKIENIELTMDTMQVSVDVNEKK